MNNKELLELGFIDNSYTEEGVFFSEFSLKNDAFRIEVSGIYLVEIRFNGSNWQTTNCKTISDIKELIRLFTL